MTIIPILGIPIRFRAPVGDVEIAITKRDPDSVFWQQVAQASEDVKGRPPWKRGDLSRSARTALPSLMEYGDSVADKT